MEDIQSSRSSTRSPIMFNSHFSTGIREPAISTQSTSDESNDEDSSDEEDESELEVPEEEQGYEDKTIKAPVPVSSPCSLPTQTTVNMSNGRTGQRKNLIVSTSSSVGDESFTTQDEVDYQLTSSMFEAPSSTLKSTPISVPYSVKTAPPRFRIGASLSSLNAKKKSILGTLPSQVNTKNQILKLADKHDEESEEESEESDSDLSDDSDNVPPQASQPVPRPSNTVDPADSDSDSDSGSDSDKYNEDEESTARNELTAHIAKLTSDLQGNTQSYGFPSPNPVKASSSQSTIKGSSSAEKKAKSENGRSYTTGYSFSQPK